SASAACWCGFDIAGLERQAAALDEQSSAPGFWDDPQAAQDVMKRLASLRQRTELWRRLESRAADLAGLIEMATAEGDESIAADITRDAEALEGELGRLEFELAFSGPYDDRNA